MIRVEPAAMFASSQGLRDADWALQGANCRLRSRGRQSRPASAASRGSPGSPRRCGTRSGTPPHPRGSSVKGCPWPSKEAMPGAVRWIARFTNASAAPGRKKPRTGVVVVMQRGTQELTTTWPPHK